MEPGKVSSTAAGSSTLVLATTAVLVDANSTSQERINQIVRQAFSNTLLTNGFEDAGPGIFWDPQVMGRAKLPTQYAQSQRHLLRRYCSPGDALMRISPANLTDDSSSATTCDSGSFTGKKLNKARGLRRFHGWNSIKKGIGRLTARRKSEADMFSATGSALSLSCHQFHAKDILDNGSHDPVNPGGVKSTLYASSFAGGQCQGGDIFDQAYLGDIDTFRSRYTSSTDESTSTYYPSTEPSSISSLAEICGGFIHVASESVHQEQNPDMDEPQLEPNGQNPRDAISAMSTMTGSSHYAPNRAKRSAETERTDRQQLANFLTERQILSPPPEY